MPQHTIDEGFNPQTGIHTRVHFEDGAIIYQKTFDLEPYLLYAKQAREQTEGKSWGNGKIIGTIPPHIHAQIAHIRDPDERSKIVMNFFRENARLQMFEKAFK